jgi:hypothetical protein
MLSLLGIVIAAVGIAAIGFGIPINEFTLGTTLIVAGVSALTGGLILIGLAAVVAELGRLGEAVRTRIAVRPEAHPAEVEPSASTMVVPAAPMVAVGARTPQTASPRARAEAQVSEARPREPRPAAELPEGDFAVPAVERLRASIPRAERSTAEPSILAHEEEVPLSPNGAAHAQTRPPHVEAAAPEPKVSPEDRGAVEALKASRLDFLFRSRPTRPASQRENFDAVWSADAHPAKRAESEPSPASEMGQVQADQAASVQDRRPEPAGEPQGAAAILKSGVVDGMAYTLYTDGSIEAKLPDGAVRFGSIAELRAHIERNS